MLPTAMIGTARRLSNPNRSSAAVAPTITRIATPRLPTMSKVVPLCGPANSNEPGPCAPNGPVLMSIFALMSVPGGGPEPAMLFNASAPPSSRDRP